MPLIAMRGSITKIKADAIVNSANPMPVFGRGTDNDIYSAAGVGELLALRRSIGALQPGQTAVTPGLKLPCRYIFHTVAEPWQGSEQNRRILRKCYEDCLRLAVEKGCKSIAFPLLGAGSYQVPPAEALTAALSRFRPFLAEHDLDIYLMLTNGQAASMAEDLLGPLRSLMEDDDAFYKTKKLSKEAPCCDLAEDMVLDEAEEIIEPPVRPLPNASAPLPSIGAKAEKSESSRFKKSLSIFKTVSKSAVPARRRLEDVADHLSESFSQQLYRLIRERGLELPQVYNKACMSKQTFHKIINGKSIPKKQTVFVLALTLELNLDETIDLLERAGYAFSPSIRQDRIVRFFIEQRCYDWEQIDRAFVAYDLSPLIAV